MKYMLEKYRYFSESAAQAHNPSTYFFMLELQLAQSLDTQKFYK